MLRRLVQPHLSVRVRLGLIQGLLLGALVIVGLTSWRVVSEERAHGQYLALLSDAARLHLHADMMHDALRADVHASLRLSPGDAVAAGDVLASQRGHVRLYRDDLEQIRRLPLEPAVIASLLSTEVQAEDYVQVASRLVETAVRDPAAALRLEPEFDAAFDSMLLVNDDITMRIAGHIESAEAAASAQSASAKAWILATCLATMLVAGVFVALISRSIRSSLRRVSDAARALAAGNLSVRSEIPSHDEVGELAGSLNKMADDLQNMIDRLLSDADRDAFAGQLMQALEMADNERDVHGVVSRAMAQITGDLPMEMMLGSQEQGALAVVSEHPLKGRPGCGVESLSGCVAVRRAGPMVFEDSDALNACPRLRGRCGGPASAVCVPVTFMGRSLGVLHAAGAARKAPTSRQVAQITVLGAQSGARIGAVRAFARAQMQANTDALTGLANRRAMETALDAMQASRAPYAFALADLDHFKRLNDTHGHEAGDKALRLFAEVLRAHVRQTDVAARWGGEEFAILFEGSSAMQVADVLDRVRAGLAETLLATGHPPFTASFGISDSRMAATFEEVSRLADAALYEAKSEGRDRVTVSAPGQSLEPRLEAAQGPESVPGVVKASA